MLIKALAVLNKNSIKTYSNLSNIKYCQIKQIYKNNKRGFLLGKKAHYEFMADIIHRAQALKMESSKRTGRTKNQKIDTGIFELYEKTTINPNIFSFNCSGPGSCGNTVIYCM